MRLSALRSRIAFFLLTLGFVALIARAVWLQVFSQDYLQREGQVRYQRTLELPASRGKILDRNGQTLATSLPASAVWVNPPEYRASEAQVLQLSRLLGMKVSDLHQRVGQEEKTFVYLRRQVDSDLARQVESLQIPGVHLRREYKRYYPEGETAAHVVGFTNVEDSGQEGIELSKEKHLSGIAGSRVVIRDRLGRIIEDVREVRDPQHGTDIALSIDSRIQFIAFNAIRDAVEEHRAKAAAAVVIDVETGELLALANWPSYNPNQRAHLSGAQLRNRVITDIFEPGSTMKPFTTALALNSARVRPESTFNVAPGRMTIGSHTISDAHAYGVLTVEQILQKSSNIGTAKMALQIPPQEMWQLFMQVGFGQVPDIGFPGAVAGRVRPHRTWKPIEQATMSYGHGISVSLLQLARAYSIFARDGELIPVTMLRHAAKAQGDPVIRAETAKTVRRMLELAAGPGGTAPQAQIQGYRVAGKTGTAHKLENGRYANKYVASFVGFAPVSDPRIIIAVMVDEPSAGKYFGGLVAAPIFARIGGESLRTMRVMPDASMQAFTVAQPVREPAPPSIALEEEAGTLSASARATQMVGQERVR
ncbi:MAG: penicillin-binding protein 2 [Betaproteobacteria bacterium]|nr:penicillin-binding protein 2 [Betaproteobacteria bacterium]